MGVSNKHCLLPLFFIAYDFCSLNERSNVQKQIFVLKSLMIDRTTCTCILCSDRHMTKSSVGIWKIVIAYASYTVQKFMYIYRKEMVREKVSCVFISCQFSFYIWSL